MKNYKKHKNEIRIPIEGVSTQMGVSVPHKEIPSAYNS